MAKNIKDETNKEVEKDTSTLLSKDEVSDVDDLVNLNKKDETEEVKEDKTLAALNEVDKSGLADQAVNDNETSKKDEKKLDSVFSSLPKYENSDETIEQKVENLRLDFKASLNKTTKFSKWGSVVAIIFLIGALGAMLAIPSNLKWISYVILGVAIVIFIVVMVLGKKEQKGVSLDISSYVLECLTTIDSYVFTRDEFSSTTYSLKARMDLEDITQAHYFDTINDFNSRNVVITTYKDKEFKVGEIACRNPYQVPADNLDHSNDNAKKKPQFSYGIFGKYVTYPLTLKEDASVIIMLKGTNAYLPTFLDGYVEIKNIEGLDENYLVWSDNNVVASSLFTKDIIELLNSFKSDDNMENIFVSINHNGLKFALNYNELVMEVPTEKKVVGTPYQHYYEDITKVLKFIDLVEGK